MLIQSSTILGLPIGSMDSQSKIGTIKNLVIDPENGELIAFFVSIGGLFQSDKVLSSHDILDFDQKGIVVRSEENLLEKNEIIKVNKIWKDRITVLNQKALTASGKNLGKINDSLIDTSTCMINKYYIHGLFEDRILSADKVVKINKKGVIFSDDIIENIPLAETESAAA